MDKDWRLDAILDRLRSMQFSELLFFVALVLHLLVIQYRVIMLQNRVVELEELLQEPETVTEEVTETSYVINAKTSGIEV